MEEKKDGKPKVKRKIRSESYKGKVKFDGTLEQMIKMAGNTTLPGKDNAPK